MADEITELQITFNFQPATLSNPKQVGNFGKTLTIADSNFSEITDETITTTPAQIDLGNVATPRLLWCENNGANEAKFASSSGGTYDTSCPAGGMILVGWTGAQIWRKATTGTTKIRYFVCGA